MVKSIKEKIIKEVELDALNLVVLDELLGENPNGHDYNYYNDESSESYWREGDSAPIQLLLDTINDLKDAGATHIEICQHTDHRGYILTGVNLTVIEDNEIEKKLAKEKIEKSIKQEEEHKKIISDALKNKESKIKELKEELKKIDND